MITPNENDSNAAMMIRPAQSKDARPPVPTLYANNQKRPQQRPPNEREGKLIKLSCNHHHQDPNEEIDRMP